MILRLVAVKVCSKAQAYSLGFDDGVEDIDVFIGENGLEETFATTYPDGSPAWSDYAAYGGSPEAAQVPARLRAAYFDGYDAGVHSVLDPAYAEFLDHGGHLLLRGSSAGKWWYE